MDYKGIGKKKGRLACIHIGKGKKMETGEAKLVGAVRIARMSSRKKLMMSVLPKNIV